MQSSSVTVAIPVINEEARIRACFESLVGQTRGFDRLVLMLNACTDSTLEICNQFGSHRAGVEIFNTPFAGFLAPGEEALRLAAHYAAAPGPDSIILTTEADAMLERSWIERNIREMENGAHVVFGKVEPQQIDDTREIFLLSVLDEISSLVDPDPNDPWPRHQQQSGASIALRHGVLQLAGGDMAEGQGLAERLRLVDARIRHAPDIVVHAPGKDEGREAVKRPRRPDELTDARLEPAIDALRRATARARMRAVRQGKENGLLLAQDLLIDPVEMNRMLDAPFHGQAWAAIQAASPVLRYRRRVAVAGLERETRIALELRDRLRIENPAAAGAQLSVSNPASF